MKKRRIDESYINKFIANYVIMERNDSYSPFHPVILIDVIKRLNGENEFKQEFINILNEKGIKVIESSSFLEREYYSYDSYKLLEEKDPAIFNNRQKQYLFILVREKQNEVARNKLVLYNLRLAIYSSWKISEENNLDCSFIDSYSYEALANAIDSFNSIDVNSFNIYTLNFINRKVKKSLKENKQIIDLYSKSKDEIECSQLCYYQIFSEDDKNNLEEILDRTLSFRKKKVIKGLVGLGLENSNTMKQLAKEFGVSESVIIRLKKEAISDLKEYMYRSGYDFDTALEEFTDKGKTYEIRNNHKKRF